MDDNEYEGPADEVFFVGARLTPDGQDSERVRMVVEQVTINITDNEIRPGMDGASAYIQ